ncbi:LD-carboxypeptidase [Candidatus Nomurabacteria bacterium]|nr:LD-carboxypeptidase [Candidatus Nomurabacteria bacterium]
MSDNFHAVDKYHVSAGIREQRADDINSMFADPEVHAIWSVHSGGTANEVLPLLDYELIKSNPKPFLGKSDVDVLLMALHHKAGVITFHGCDTKIGREREFDFAYTQEWFQKRMMEDSKEIVPSGKPWKTIAGGSCEGKILGANISTLVKLSGTPYCPDFHGAILLLESYESTPRDIIWKLTHLKQTGMFDGIVGIILGSNFGYKDPSGHEAFEVYRDILEEYNVPMMQVDEFGHYQPHAFWPIGARVKMDADKQEIAIVEDVFQS